MVAIRDRLYRLYRHHPECLVHMQYALGLHMRGMRFAAVLDMLGAQAPP